MNEPETCLYLAVIHLFYFLFWMTFRFVFIVFESPAACSFSHYFSLGTWSHISICCTEFFHQNPDSALACLPPADKICFRPEDHAGLHLFVVAFFISAHQLGAISDGQHQYRLLNRQFLIVSLCILKASGPLCSADGEVPFCANTQCAAGGTR